MMSNKSIEFSKKSLELTKTIEKITKNKEGIFFTPKSIIEKNIKILEPYFKNIKTVLEPSCGSCAYILEVNKQYPDLTIMGIENNETIYNSIKELSKTNIEIIHGDYLKYETSNKYDLIIGNPPFVVIDNDIVDDKYLSYYDNRPNLFILFIIKSLEQLNDGGILSFVLPKNFINCMYYNKTRKYISDNYNIIDIIDFSEIGNSSKNDNKKGYEDTEQNTILLIIQNTTKNDNSRFVITKSYKIKKKNSKPKKTYIITKYINIFGTSENIKSLNKLYTNSTTLNDLGFNINIGSKVWNQCTGGYKPTKYKLNNNTEVRLPIKKKRGEKKKDYDIRCDRETKHILKILGEENKEVLYYPNILTNDSSKTRLIYNTDIVDNKLIKKIYPNKKKCNYIDAAGLSNPLLVLNRGMIGGEYKFNYCLLDGIEEYLCENHLICIKYSKPISNSELIDKYKTIIKSFENKKTVDFIKLYFGNNAINTTELKFILPIYDI